MIDVLLRTDERMTQVQHKTGSADGRSDLSQQLADDGSRRSSTLVMLYLTNLESISTLAAQ